MTIPMLLPLCAANSFAQEDFRFDAGGGIGMAGYLGDANTSGLFSAPSLCGEAVFRYIASPRWALRSDLCFGKLRGNTSRMTNVSPGFPSYSFSTSFVKVAEMAEFNFFNYGIGETYRKLVRWTPYITAGLGVSTWSVTGESGVAFSLPVGAGVKYKPSRRVNLDLGFVMTKTFTDRLDGTALDDPTGIESSFAKNTDWISTLTFSVTYEFSKRCAVCNYKD